MCMIDDCDERVNIIQESKRVARKPHHCEECRKVIQVGEQYQYEFGTMAGETCTYKTCLNCMKCRDWLQDLCGGFLYGGVEEDVKEHFLNYDKSYGSWWSIGRMVIGMRNQWKPRVFKNASSS